MFLAIHAKLIQEDFLYPHQTHFLEHYLFTYPEAYAGSFFYFPERVIF